MLENEFLHMKIFEEERSRGRRKEGEKEKGM
jgi:hypothetical protein